LWIDCYRYDKLRRINTNNYIEAYYKKIKYLYLTTRLNRCIDFLIHELTVNILHNYCQETIQYELGIGWMRESIFIVKSAHDEGDYIHIFAVSHKYKINIPDYATYLLFDKYVNNVFEVEVAEIAEVADVGAGVIAGKVADVVVAGVIANDSGAKSVSCVVSKVADNTTNNQEKESKINNCLDQWLECLKMLHQEVNLNKVTLSEKENVIKELEKICNIFLCV
ncbi:3778_t:CDS:2, partial [Cetraspora pellucida]